jgi:hypothetical protein
LSDEVKIALHEWLQDQPQQFFLSGNTFIGLALGEAYRTLKFEINLLIKQLDSLTWQIIF